MTDLEHTPPKLLLVQPATGEKRHGIEDDQPLFSVIQKHGLVPADPLALQRLMAAESPSNVQLESVVRAIENELSQRRIQVVYIGASAHLVPANRGAGSADLAPPPAVESAVTVADEPAQTREVAFRLTLALDAAHERALLYRVLIVLDLVAALVLLREMVL